MDFDPLLSKLLHSSQTISRSDARRFGFDRPAAPATILQCPYKAATDEFVGKAISVQTDSES